MSGLGVSVGTRVGVIVKNGVSVGPEVGVSGGTEESVRVGATDSFCVAMGDLSRVGTARQPVKSNMMLRRITAMGCFISFDEFEGAQ
jgi:hypothetical protein